MKRALASLAVLALAMPAGTAPALPPALAGALASDNVEWVATIPDPPGVSARIVGDTMYVSTNTGIRIYDVSGGLPVPKGVLLLPNYLNEDVATNGQILLVATDNVVGVAQTLTVVDVSDASSPAVIARIDVSAAHTATCINGCSFAWMSGATGRVFVVDLTDPSAPVERGSFAVPGRVHDVQVDEAGIAWVSTGGGLFAFTTADPLNPVPVVSVENRRPGAFENDFIVHNSLRPDATSWAPRAPGDTAGVRAGELVLVTEEDWATIDNGRCTNDGVFQTGRYIQAGATKTLEKLDTWNIGRGTVAVDRKTQPVVSCSSHYFDMVSPTVVAVSWYEQGVRFLDVSVPTDIRQVGYFLPLHGESLSVIVHGDYVYSLDTVRGMDVLRFTGGSGDPEVMAPRYNPVRAEAVPSPRFGWLCRIPA